jgi:large repetitive protein
MSVSKLLPSGGVNDFFVTLTSTYTSVVFVKDYASGNYTISSSINDLTYDIYALNSAGTVVGYTKSPSLTVTGGFNKLVILGQTTGNLLTFTYKTTYTSTNETDETAVGAVVASVSPTDVPNVDSTTVVTGRNFASNVQFYFSDGSTSRVAKSVSRTSATSATVTRPDVLPLGTYTITAINPDAENPTGSNSHILENCITAGNAPVWSTSATLPVYTKGVAYSQTLVATDSSDPGSTITYSQISSSLPSGITFTATTGVIAGTSTVTDTGSVNVRATDSGGNYVDRVFTLTNVGANAPVWGAAPTLPISGSAYSYTCTATDDSGATPTFSLTGTLPTGLSFNSSTGVISGTTTDGTVRSITLTATDANGSFTDLVVNPFRAATLGITSFTSSGTYTPITGVLNNVLIVGGGAGGGGTNNYGTGGGSGGGGGGVVRQFTSVAVTSGQAYAIVIGSGAAAANLNTGNGSIALNGNKSSAFGQEAFGGQGGMNCGNGWSQPRTSERGNGGGNASYGFGSSNLSSQVVDQGNLGNEVGNNTQGGGGGASSGGPSGSVIGVNGVTWSVNGTTYGGGGAGGPGTYSGGTGGGGSSNYSGGSSTNATFYGGGGGGMSAANAVTTNGGSGYQGIVLVYAYQ